MLTIWGGRAFDLDHVDLFPLSRIEPCPAPLGHCGATRAQLSGHLLGMGVVPIVNENDSVSVRELET